MELQPNGIKATNLHVQQSFFVVGIELCFFWYIVLDLWLHRVELIWHDSHVLCHSVGPMFFGQRTLNVLWFKRGNTLYEDIAKHTKQCPCMNDPLKWNHNDSLEIWRYRIINSYHRNMSKKKVILAPIVAQAFSCCCWLATLRANTRAT